MDIRNPRTGIQMNYTDQGCGDPPIICVHGWTGNHTRWAPAQKLMGQKHRVIGYDLRGHGRTDKSGELNYDFPTHAEDLAGLMDALEIPRAVIAGHSMGGMVAQQFALTYPERVDCLALVATASSTASDDPLRHHALHIASWCFRNFFQLCIDFKDRKKKEAPRDYYPDIYDATLRTTPAASAACLEAIAHLDLREEVKKLKIPTLVIASVTDGTIPYAHTWKLAHDIPTARFVSTTNTSHQIPIEKPEFIAGNILSFIEETRERPKRIEAKSARG